MNDNKTRVYNKDLKILAILENATVTDIARPINELWTSKMMLPANDPKNKHCEDFNFVELFDDGKTVGIFRIVGSEYEKSSEKTITYDLEHGISTLLDAAIPGYHQKVNLTTRENIEFLLSFQHTKHWVLDRCDFNNKISYKWESENGIWNALQSIVKPFIDSFEWKFDTSSYPWSLSLIKPSREPKARIRYGYNMRGITRNIDARDVVTRVRPLGYGEGVNQLTIAEVNGGKEYIDADQSLIDKYGIVEYILVDRSIENAKTLKDIGQKTLNEYKIPPVSYEVDAANVYPITGLSVDKFNTGDMVRVTDDDLGAEFDGRIVKINRPDPKGKPGDVSLEIERKTKDLSDTMADLRQRDRIHDTYAQGATNMYQYSVNENADGDNPAVIRFYIPPEAIKVNKLFLSFETTNFRGYSKATKGGGATTRTTSSGGGTTVTSASGGASTQTSSSGGGVSKSTSAGGSTTQTSSSGGNHRHRMFAFETDVGDTNPGNYKNFTAADSGGGATGIVIPAGSKNDLYTKDSSGTHTHSVSIPNHTHNFSTPNHTHSVKIPSHKHDVKIPSHTHKVTIPDHTHAIEYGIYKGPKPTKMSLKVDGQKVPVGLGEENLDIKPYLSKDGGGKPQTGMHELELSPNDLGRISGNLFIQCFIQSRS